MRGARSLGLLIPAHKKNPERLARGLWCPRTELNRRHGDFQSPALPTELLGRSVAGRRVTRSPPTGQAGSARQSRATWRLSSRAQVARTATTGGRVPRTAGRHRVTDPVTDARLRSTANSNDVSVSVWLGNIQRRFSTTTNTRQAPCKRDLQRSQIADCKAPMGAGDER